MQSYALTKLSSRVCPTLESRILAAVAQHEADWMNPTAGNGDS